jgi:hypothetical protein
LDEGIEYLIDVEDYERLDGGVYVNSDPVGYLRISGSGQLLHRWILGLSPGDSRVGDHVNRDVLDNRRSNLRIVTPTQSNYNRRAWNRDGLPVGITLLPSGRYQSRLKCKGVEYRLGTYDTPEEASAARKSLLGKFRGQG